MSKVSVIVPVYNAEKTIERCVNSIRNQTYRDLEIILVDDASTDKSREILMELEQSDPERILVVCNDRNSGPGGARNIALQYASGDYIGFVDSDDYIQSAFYEKLVHEIETGPYDIVDCGYYDEKNDRAMLHTGRGTRGVLDDVGRSELIVSGGYLWSRLYRRKLFADNNIRFRENCILEDSEVLVELIARAVSVGAVEETLYWYSRTEGSSSSTRNPVSYVSNISEAIHALASLSEKLDNYDRMRTAIEYEIIQMYSYGVIMILKDAQTTRRLDTILELKKLAELRSKAASCGYENQYVLDKIAPSDIDIMKKNDEDPFGLNRSLNR